MTHKSPAELPSATALAFLGDAVYSLHVRRALMQNILLGKESLHDMTQHYVTAQAQARAFSAVEPYLTEEEADLCHRARNSNHLSKPRHAAGGDYRAATALEALLGMLYYNCDTDRLGEILDICMASVPCEEII